MTTTDTMCSVTKTATETSGMTGGTMASPEKTETEIPTETAGASRTRLFPRRARSGPPIFTEYLIF